MENKKTICLVDVDSSIPNLVLMKISAFYKEKSFEVDLKKIGYTGYDHCKRKEIIIDGSNYEKVFISAIFPLNKDLIKVRNCKEVYHGGIGYDYKITLQKEIEHIFPDYSLYPDNEYSIGYLTRGCIRNCEFCFIPKKEGILKFNAFLKEFYDPKQPKIMLLDNNFLALPNQKCVELLEELKGTGKIINFKQGLDFRLLTKEKAKALIELRYDGNYIFAFDCIRDKPIIERNLKEIWKPLTKAWQTKFFVLVGFNSTLEQDLERVYFLKSHKCLPYIMRYETCYSSSNRPFYTDLAAWCNQPGFFKNMSFTEFLKIRHSTKERLMQTIKIIEENNLRNVIS